MKPAYELIKTPKLVIADGAGTLFDPGSIAPVYAFQHSFKHNLGLDVDEDIIKRDLGANKRKHLQKLFQHDDLLELFIKKGKKPTMKDKQLVYDGFKEGLYATVKNKTGEIDQVKEAAFRLKESKIDIIMTTGYDRRTVDLIMEKLSWLDKVLLTSFTSDDAPEGRPYPYLIYHSMEYSGIENVGHALKAGDTKLDIEAPDNARMPGIIVLTGSIQTTEEAQKMNEELDRKHLILPSLVDVINFILDETLIDRIKELNSQ